MCYSWLRLFKICYFVLFLWYFPLWAVWLSSALKQGYFTSGQGFNQTSRRSWWCGAGQTLRRSNSCSSATEVKWVHSELCEKFSCDGSALTLWHDVSHLFLDWNKRIKLLHQLDPTVSSTAWGFKCHYPVDIYIIEVSVEHILKLSVYSAQPLLAGCIDKLVGYSKLRSLPCSWHLATGGLAWQLQMRPQGWDWRGGMGKTLDLRWVSASSLKRFLQEARWRTVWAGGAFPKLPWSLRGIKQLCCSSHNHLAAAAAGPKSALKICSSRCKDSQYTSCPVVLCHIVWKGSLQGGLQVKRSPEEWTLLIVLAFGMLI